MGHDNPLIQWMIIVILIYKTDWLGKHDWQFGELLMTECEV
jgi:hypothetical protein